MTKINRLVMQGFKSFAKRTEILMGDKFNCVVGPNGSGKSNILDALCFVLGRGSAKAMRAEKSSNLIYDGHKTKQPAKYGEVSIYFDNSKDQFQMDGIEIKISRIVNQNGNSKYKINNKTRTKQEIIDLLSKAKIDPDGFNIVLQGDITRFVEMAPVERRQLIEEIAGISIYEDRKQKALSELNGVDQKMNDAEIILSERKNYLKDLKHDRDQALRFKEVKDKIDENKASYLNIQIRKNQAINLEFTEKLNKEKFKIQEIEAQIKELKDANDKRKKEIDNISREIEEKGEKEQVALHKEIEALKVSLAANKSRIESCKGEVEKIKQRKAQLNNDLKELAGKAKGLEEDKKKIAQDKENKLKDEKSIDSSIANFRKKNKLDDITGINRQIAEIDAEGEELQKQITVIRQEQQDMLRKKDQIEFQLRTLDERLSKVKEVESENQEQIKNLKNRKDLFKNKTLELNKCLSEDTSLAARLREAKTREQIANEKLMKLHAKNASIIEANAGNIAIQKIKEMKKSGVYGTIAELGQVDSKYSLALEVAAGNKIESIVVENDRIAAECIKYLKTSKLGIATFIPLNKIKAPKISQDTKAHADSRGVHGLAIGLVKFENRFKDAFSYVFGNTLVVDDIDTARRIGIGTAKMATLDGDLADSSGVMRGGYRKRKQGIGFVENEMNLEINRCSKETGEMQSLISALGRKRAENEELISKLRQEKAELEGEIIKIEKSLHLESGDLEASMKQKGELDKELKETDAKLKEVHTKVTQLNAELAKNKTKKQELRNAISALDNPRLLAELHTFEENKASLRNAIIELDTALRNAEVHLSLIEPEKVKILDIIKQHDKEIDGFEAEVKALSNNVTETDKSLSAKEVQAKEFYAKYKTLFNKRGGLSDEISKSELKIDTLREGSRKAEISMNTLSLENSHIGAELKAQEAEFEQYTGIKLSDLPEADLKKEIDKFEKMVNNMGAVNMKALEIYGNVETEYNSLMDKRQSLGKEKEDVLLLINEIEARKKEIFVDAFNIVNENFKKFFLTLSKKGEASLLVENPDTVFDAGVLIKVRLAGTKFLDIRSLSGGEKTMTALAFIFAIQEHQPHSFYVLDEVDAALDKHNSEKLAKLIRKYCDNAQYLVISHNDALISESDNLYGISMNEHGMSNITSLKL